MNFEEHVGKPLLAAAGILVPRGLLVTGPAAAAHAFAEIGPAVVKAQVPAGKRGKAGGVRLVESAAAAEAAARDILGMTIGGFAVERLLVEERVPIARELYAAVLSDPASKGPLVLCSTMGGMDIEAAAAQHPETVRRATVDIRHGFGRPAAAALLEALDLGGALDPTADVLVRLYELWRARDAELIEINPLVVTGDGRVMALDCKLVLDDAALSRQPELARLGAPEPMTALERRGQEAGLRYIELTGSVGVLANGAGLTMTTMDAIRHYGGEPANFLEIGGEAYTKSRAALELVLDNPKVRSLLVNFCGAFARTDVMTEGVVAAWQALRPQIPVAFTVHGTGEAEAIALIRDRLGIEPHDLMDDAVRAAVAAAA